MPERPVVRIQRESEFRDVPLPEYATPLSAGMDLHAATRAEITLQPGQWRLVSTGIRIAIPPGFEGQVRPRSGLALKYGVTLLNTPGTIDADYRGIIGVILINLGDAPFIIRRGDRIAQLVFSPIGQFMLEEVNALSSTQRGPHGFGSTGVTRQSAAREEPGETSIDFLNQDYPQENDVTIPGSSEK